MLSEDEVTRLLKVTLAGESVLGFTPIDRHMLYVMAMSTGLRASELASLTVESLQLEANPPTVTVQAGYSKRRRLDVLPLPADILELAREWIATKVSTERLWPGNWAARRAGGKILQADLKVADIPYQDAKGLFADFHALRHTYITNLARNGVPLATAQKLARHSTPVLTAQRYTHIDLNDQKPAVDRLPLLQRTDDFRCPNVAKDGIEQGGDTQTENPVDSSESEEKTGFSQRRRRDSNSRCPFGHTGFRDRWRFGVTNARYAS